MRQPGQHTYIHVLMDLIPPCSHVTQTHAKGKDTVSSAAAGTAHTALNDPSVEKSHAHVRVRHSH